MLIVGSEPAHYLKPASYRIAYVYASTECCAVISIHWITEEQESYPAGIVVPTLHWMIADEQGRKVRPGEIGELLLAGGQICCGYLDLPLKNHKTFAPNPYSRDPDYRRMYRTGDLMSQDENGELVFHGRMDAMVKVRGFRIELSAVEVFLLRFPGIGIEDVWDSLSACPWVYSYKVTKIDQTLQGFGGRAPDFFAIFA